jgi:hypothetical protein
LVQKQTCRFSFEFPNIFFIWQEIWSKDYQLFFFYEKCRADFRPRFLFRTGLFFFLRWKDHDTENFYKKITSTKISCWKKFFPFRFLHNNFRPTIIFFYFQVSKTEKKSIVILYVLSWSNFGLGIQPACE